jgi:hypothetical protein
MASEPDGRSPNETAFAVYARAVLPLKRAAGGDPGPALASEATVKAIARGTFGKRVKRLLYHGPEADRF